MPRPVGTKTEDFAADVALVSGLPLIPKILHVACRLSELRFAAIARVTGDRWVACAIRDEIAFGLAPGDELPIETTLCQEVRAVATAVAIDDVTTDETYSNHHTPAIYGFRSYIAVPILRKDGSIFGTLCAIDPEPRRVKTPEIIGLFEMFADLIGQHLTAVERVAASEATLLDAQRTAALREQFIAVLGHDLRNPLAAIDGGMRLLRKTPLNDQALHVAEMVQASVGRMGGLIDNLVDFARFRLGGGLLLRQEAVPMDDLLRQVVLELRMSRPDRVIETAFRLEGPVVCDRQRMAQLVSNLLGNALTHGAPDQPVRLSASAAGGWFELAVANGGEPIPSAMLPSLFQPFSRGAHRPNSEGLGLGLYIASQIAEAHGGAIEVVSGPAETRFALRMPLPG